MALWNDCKLPGVPGEVAAMIGVCLPDNGGTMEILFAPDGDFSINAPAGFRHSAALGRVVKSTSGGKAVWIHGGGYFELGWGRMTRKGIALRIASRLAGLTIRRTEHEYLNRCEVTPA